VSWATWLVSLAGPLLLQALVALGVGVVTVSGIDLAVNTAMSWVSTAVGGLGSDLLNLLALGGVFQGMSYVGGAFAARIAMAGVAGAFKRFFLQ
jgi:hypothetical protein